MRRTYSVKFGPPVIIGALCTDLKEVPSRLIHAFAKLKPRVAFLPFQVEPRYLKNVIACMKLMDIHGLVVLGKHQKDIVRHLERLDGNARSCGCVDLIVRDGRGFVGTVSCDGPTRLSARQVGKFYLRCVEVLTHGLDLA